MGLGEYEVIGETDLSQDLTPVFFRDSGLIIPARGIIGVGVDQCDVPRIQKDTERSPIFIRRIFTQEEIDYCEDAKMLRAESYAARFAAKEAVAKAIGGMPHRFLDVCVTKMEDGKPGVELRGRAKEYASQIGVEEIFLSLTHLEETAIAFCIAYGDYRPSLLSIKAGARVVLNYQS